MKLFETIKYFCSSEILIALTGLLVLGISTSAFAVGYDNPNYAPSECVQDLPGATTVLKAMGIQSCKNISGQVAGCRIKKGNGDCRAYDANGNLLFTAWSKYTREDGLSWTIGVPEGGILTRVDAVTLNGARRGNACAYIYSDEASSGSGMGDYKAARENFANLQYAEFCTDGINQNEPTPLPDCSEIDTDLDGTGIDCSTLDPNSERFLISLDPNSPEWNATACTCNVTFTSCNQDATVDDVDSNKCMGDMPLKALPVTFEAGNDGTWICRTIGGRRKCWSR